jgi:hypothetical protein
LACRHISELLHRLDRAWVVTPYVHRLRQQSEGESVGQAEGQLPHVCVKCDFTTQSAERIESGGIAVTDIQPGKESTVYT